eukprot:6322760-Amphidinium_carterae.1
MHGSWPRDCANIDENRRLVLFFGLLATFTGRELHRDVYNFQPLKIERVIQKEHREGKCTARVNAADGHSSLHEKEGVAG